jgi:hypothetical protein
VRIAVKRPSILLCELLQLPNMEIARPPRLPKLIAVCSLVGAMVGLAASNELRVGSATLLVPAPEGFALVTKDMVKLDTALDLNTPDGSKRLVSFIPESCASTAKERMPEFDRSFHIQVADDMVQSTVSQDWFLEYRAKTRALLTEVTKSDRRKLSPELQAIEKQMKDQDDVENSLGLSIDSVTFPPHQETDRVFTYSGLSRSEGDDRQPNPHTTANTVAALFVKEKVIMVLVSGGRYDLAWTRSACSNWTAAILTANTSPGDVLSMSRKELPLSIAPDRGQAKPTKQGDVLPGNR